MCSKVEHSGDILQTLDKAISGVRRGEQESGKKQIISRERESRSKEEQEEEW